MHRATIAILLGVCASVFAQQGDIVRARIRVPGEGNIAEQFDFADWRSLLIDMQLTNEQMAEVEAKVAELNAKRKELFATLKAAKEELEAVEQKINETSNALVSQEKELHAFIKSKAPLEKQQTYDQRAALLPLIKWLDLTDAQVNTLMTKLEPLRSASPIKEIKAGLAEEIPADLDYEARVEARAKRVALLKQYQKFTVEWMKAIRDELTPEQQKKWDLRYHRTRFSVEVPGADL
jgi:septal ring factor EnvC (AmiA/AmiB activator)